MTNVRVEVINNDVVRALKVLKRAFATAGLFREIRAQSEFVPASLRRRRKSLRARKRAAKTARRIERLGMKEQTKRRHPRPAEGGQVMANRPMCYFEPSHRVSGYDGGDERRAVP
jgi:ribosomal protein S21